MPVSGRARTLAGLIRACHPEPTAAVTLVATALALAVGLGARAGWVAAAVLAGQLSVGWSNDLLDRHRDHVAVRRDKPLAPLAPLAPLGPGGPAGSAARGELSARTVALAAGIAAAACVPLSLATGVPAGSVHLLAVASAWSYNLGVKATAVSVLPYVVSFGLLPAYIVLSLPGDQQPPAWLIATGALLGAGAHFANALPDLADDARAGIRGLPHRLGPVASRVGAAVLLLAATGVLVVSGGTTEATGILAFAAAVVLVAIGLARSTRPGSRAAFRLTLVVAAVDVVLLLLRSRSLS